MHVDTPPGDAPATVCLFVESEAVGGTELAIAAFLRSLDRARWRMSALHIRLLVRPGLEHHVCIRAAEAKRAHASDPPAFSCNEGLELGAPFDDSPNWNSLQ